MICKVHVRNFTFSGGTVKIVHNGYQMYISGTSRFYHSVEHKKTENMKITFIKVTHDIKVHEVHMIFTKEQYMSLNYLL